MNQTHTNIDSLLRQLPVEHRQQPKVRYDILAVLETYKSLTLKVGDFVNNDGSEQKLPLLTGTIPIVYQYATYNIPVELFIKNDYPQMPPLIYVRPTSSMMVKPNHTYVNANGLVNIPYTQRWVPSCTLRDLVIALISIFNNDPPLFSKPPVVDEPIPSWVLDDSRASAALSGSLSARNNISNRSVNNGNNNHFNNMDNPNSNSSIENSSSSGGKAELIEQVTLKMQAYMHQRLSKICEEIDTELWTQQRLNERIQKIEQIQRDLRAQTGKFKESRERVLAKTVQLDQWAVEREKNLQERSDRPDHNVVAHDNLSNQIIGLASENLAIDDALYYLEQALSSSENSFDLQGFLAESKSLSRQQFICKAQLHKIHSTVCGYK